MGQIYNYESRTKKRRVFRGPHPKSDRFFVSDLRRRTTRVVTFRTEIGQKG